MQPNRIQLDNQNLFRLLRVNFCYSPPAVLSPRGLSMTLITSRNKKRGRTSTVWATDRLHERRREESRETWNLQLLLHPGRIMKPLTHGASWTVSVWNYRNLHVILHSLNCSIELLFFSSSFYHVPTL